MVDHYSEVKQDGHNVCQDKREEYAKEQQAEYIDFLVRTELHLPL